MFMNDRFFLEGRSQPKRRKVIIEVPLKNHFHAGAHYNSPQEAVVTEKSNNSIMYSNYKPEAE